MSSPCALSLVLAADFGAGAEGSNGLPTRTSCSESADRQVVGAPHAHAYGGGNGGEGGREDGEARLLGKKRAREEMILRAVDFVMQDERDKLENALSV